MTTIAANLKQMAADTALVTGGPIATVSKIHRIRESIFGEAGAGFECLLLIEWLKGKRDRRALQKMPDEFQRDDVYILELSPTGLALWNGWGIRMPIADECYSIGSGSMAAMAALRAGADPEEAVKIAAELDENTREPIEVLSLQ